MKYDVFGKLNRKNLTKLCLDSCKNNKISLLMPVPNVDNIDKLNSESGYYNDLCYTATSESGPDIPLDERKKEYIVNAVCQDGCEFSDYDYNTKKAKCSCDAKESAASFKDMKIDKKKLLDNFKNIKNFLNFNLLKCGKVLFSKQGISKNIGFYIFIPIIIFHTLVIILFYLKKLDLLLNKIKDIILGIKYLMLRKSQDKKEILKQEEKNKELVEMDSKDKESEIFRLRLNKINNNTKINNNPHNTDIINKYKLNGDIIIIETKKYERNIRNIFTEKNDKIINFKKIKNLSLYWIIMMKK